MSMVGRAVAATAAAFQGGRTVAPVPWLEQRSTLADPAEWLVDALGGSRTAAGVRVSEESAFRIDAVYASVALIAGQVGSLPFQVLSATTGSDGRRVRRSRPELPQWEMLHDEPNPGTPADVFYEALVAGALLWGNGYGECVTDRYGVVREIYNTIPGRIDCEISRTGERRYHVQGEPGKTSGRERFLHLQNLSTDGRQGVSPIRAMRETIGTIAARDSFEAQLYANASIPGGIVQVKGELSETAARRLRDQIEAVHRGEGNRHRVAVLEDGTEWQSVGMPLADLEFIARSRFSVAQIARMFMLAPELIGGDRQGSLTYSNVEQQAIQFVKFTLRRWTTRLERALRATPGVFPDRMTYGRFNTDALLRGDSKTRAEVHKLLIDAGVISPNEARETEDMAPRDGGDEYALPGSGAAVPASTVAG